MKKAGIAIGLLALLALLPLAALAQGDIPRGGDAWTTIGGCGGGPETFITLGASDWETLCGHSGEDQKIVFTGDSAQGQGDIVITRLEDAKFDGAGEASVKVQATSLAFRSVGASQTPCGALTFRVGLEGGEQPTTTMYIHRTSDGGGTFDADLEINTKVTAINSKGKVVGSVEKSGTLLNPDGGTPWGRKAPAGANDPKAAWYPGVNPNGMLALPVRPHDRLLAQHAYAFPNRAVALVNSRAGVPANCPAQ